MDSLTSTTISTTRVRANIPTTTINNNNTTRMCTPTPDSTPVPTRVVQSPVVSSAGEAQTGSQRIEAPTSLTQRTSTTDDELYDPTRMCSSFHTSRSRSLFPSTVVVRHPPSSLRSATCNRPCICSYTSDWLVQSHQLLPLPLTPPPLPLSKPLLRRLGLRLCPLRSIV